MKKLLLFLAVYCIATQHSFAQNIAINDNGALPDTSAILDLSSTTKGFLPPRMTLTQRDLIPLPKQGLLIYQTDNDSGFYYYTGSIWTKLGQDSVPTCKSIIPQPVFPIDNMGYTTLYSNTLAFMGQVHIPLKVNAKTITIATNNPPSIPGKIKIALYSETGDNKIFEVITDSIFNNGPVTTSLIIPVNINPGFYYISVMSLGNCNVQIIAYVAASFGYYLFNPSSGNKLQGYINISPDILPLSFSPSSITYETTRCLGFRIN